MTYISALPTPPSRSDDPTGFSNKADALLAALPAFVTEANTLSDEVDAMRDDAEAKRAATEALRDETSTLKGQAEAARYSAKFYKDTANTYRVQAEAARDSAQTIAAAYGGELGLPSLTGKSLSVMRVNEGETGVEWANAIRRLPIFSPEAASLNAVSIGEIIGDTAVNPSPANQATGLHATNSMFICTGDSSQNVKTSPDGRTWTLRAATPTPLDKNLFVAASPSGTVIAISGMSTATRKSTDHGVTWSAGGTLPTFAGSGQRIAYANGRFLVFSSGTTGYVSADDGDSWTLTTIPMSTVLLSIGDVFIATYNNMTYYTSPDGVTWTERTKPSAGNVVRHGGIVLNTSNAMKTHYSQDGISWTELPIGFSYRSGASSMPVLINGVFANILGHPESGIDFTIHNGKWIHRKFNTNDTPVFIAQNATHSVFLSDMSGFSINHADTRAYFESVTLYDQCSLDLNFAKQEYRHYDGAQWLVSHPLTPFVTFTRSTTASYIGADGLLKTAAIDEPRIDYDPITGECKGLLIEESRVNLLKHSEAFSGGWGNINALVEDASVVSPDGISTFKRFKEDVFFNSAGYIPAHSINFTAGTSYVFSLFAKEDLSSEKRYCNILLPLAAFAAWIVISVDLADGSFQTVGSPSLASVDSVGDGVWRISIGAVATASVSAAVQVRSSPLRNLGTYNGDGTSGLYIWGAQLEAGSFPTSYIKTESSAVTRAADNASVTGANFSSWYRQDEGSLLLNANWHYVVNTGSSVNYGPTLSDGTSNNRIGIMKAAASNVVQAIVSTGGEFMGAPYTNSIPESSMFATTLAYKIDDIAIAAMGSINGVGGTDNSCSIPVVNRLYIGDHNGAVKAKSHISRLTYWPKRLTNTQLQELSK